MNKLYIDFKYTKKSQNLLNTYPENQTHFIDIIFDSIAETIYFRGIKFEIDTKD